jgi:hypothetical protein
MDDILSILAKHLDVVLPLVAGAVSVLVVYWLRKHFTTRDETSAMDTRLTGDARDLAGRVDRMEDRLTEVEHSVRGLPTQAQVQELLVGQARMEGALEAMREHMCAMENNVKLLMRVHTREKP